MDLSIYLYNYLCILTFIYGFIYVFLYLLNYVFLCPYVNKIGGPTSV